MATAPPKRTRRKWQAHPNDAIKLAALRWYALMAETSAIQLYATNPGNFDATAGIMREAIKKMEKVGQSLGDSGTDCPQGYVWCGRECAPMCDVID